MPSDAANTSAQAWGSGWILPMLLVLLLAIAFSLYKLCVAHTVLENGRIVRTVNIHPLLGRILTFFGVRPQPQHFTKNLTPELKQIMSLLFGGHTIVFGILVYCLGLYLLARGLLEISRMSMQYTPIWPYFFLVSGLVAIAWGVYAVIHRHRFNPFTEADG